MDPAAGQLPTLMPFGSRVSARLHVGPAAVLDEQRDHDAVPGLHAWLAPAARCCGPGGRALTHPTTAFRSPMSLAELPGLTAGDSFIGGSPAIRPSELFAACTAAASSSVRFGKQPRLQLALCRPDRAHPHPHKDATPLD